MNAFVLLCLCCLQVFINKEIEDLEQFVMEEEKYVNVMDRIDSLKKQKGNESGFDNARYINIFYDKKMNGLSIDVMVNELNVNEMDALGIEKCIFILRRKFIDMSNDGNEPMESVVNNNSGSDGGFYKIEQMLKTNRRETESKFKQLESKLKQN